MERHGARARHKNLGSNRLRRRMVFDGYSTHLAASPVGRSVIFGAYDAARNPNARFGSAFCCQSPAGGNDVGNTPILEKRNEAHIKVEICEQILAFSD